ncbi:MAG: hypothetical protein EXS55_00395 [Candidatus Magasanikbacteria bacterium]|nr:hypothetical protein [Candidatus Magasanikbacteria bacterium]
MTPENRIENLVQSLETRKKYLAAFVAYRNDYLEDLPPKKLMPVDPNYLLYKCRGSCFVGVRARINALVEQGIISNPVTLAKIKEFNEYMTTRDWSRFSTQDDIDILNRILDVMINELT